MGIECVAGTLITVMDGVPDGTAVEPDAGTPPAGDTVGFVDERGVDAVGLAPFRS